MGYREGTTMHTLTADDLTRQPQRLIDDARRGESALITSDGEPVLLAVPLDGSAASQPMRIELAARLFDSDQISLGVAASIAGLPYSAMIDELGRRGIAVVRYGADELAQELDYARTLVGGR
jgi:predicted HTH domain antitoxin